MAGPYKPEGYPSAAPYIVCKDAAALLDFLGEVFGAATARRFDREDGSIMHAEARIDDAIIMIGGANAEWGPVTAWVHVYVPDVRAVHQRALAAGASELLAPEQKAGDTDLRGGFTDPWGNCWFPATQMENE